MIRTGVSVTIAHRAICQPSTPGSIAGETLGTRLDMGSEMYPAPRSQKGYLVWRRFFVFFLRGFSDSKAVLKAGQVVGAAMKAE